MQWLLVLALLVGGCGGPGRGVSTYLRQLQPFQLSLRDFKSQLAGIQQLPIDKRSPAYKELAARVRARGRELARLQPPPPAAELHKDTLELFAILSEYLELAASSAGPDDTPLKGVALRWQETMNRTQAAMDRLGR